MGDQKCVDDSSNGSVRGLATTDFSRRQVLGGLAASAVMVVFPILDLGRRNLAQAQGNSQITIGPLELSKEVAFAEFKYNTSGDRVKYTKDLWTTYDVIQWMDAHPNATVDDSVREGTNIQKKYEAKYQGETDAYRNAMAAQDSNLAFLETLALVPGTEILPEAVQIGYEHGVIPYEKEKWDATNRFEAANVQFEDKQAAAFFEGGIRKQAQDRAFSGDPSRQSLTREVLAKLNLEHIASVPSPGTTNAAAMLDNKPQLAPAGLRDHISSDGSITISEQKVRELMDQELAGIDKTLKDQTALLNKIANEQSDFIAWAKGKEEERKRLEEEAKRNAQEAQLKLAGARSSVYLLSQLLGSVNPKAGNAITVLGNSTIDVADAVSKFAQTMADFAANKLSGLAAGMSAAIFTGNVVSAVMNIISIFGGPPSIEDQIALLRKEMEERFDRIDARLNDIYYGILDKIQDVIIDVNAIQRDLVDLELQLTSLGSNVLESLGTEGRRPLLEAINGGIFYKERLPNREMEFPTYEGYENLFHSWATLHAKDELEQDTNNRPYDDDKLLGELSRPLENNVMYLARFLTNRPGWNVPSFTTGRIAHPAIWAMSSRAYAELRREWPEHAKEFSATRNEQVRQAGVDLQDALRRITVKSTGDPNHALFSALINNYLEKLESLDEKLQGAENAYLEEKQGDWDEARLSNYKEEGNQRYLVSFWGAPTQRIGYVPEFPSTPEGIQPPDTLASVIPTPYILAMYMVVNPGRLTVTYQGGWKDFTLYSRTSRWSSGTPQVKIFVWYRGITYALARSVTGSNAGFFAPGTIDVDKLELDRTYPFVADNMVLQWEWTNGQNLRAKFDGGASEELPLPGNVPEDMEWLLNTTTAQVSEQLQMYQRNTYDEIANSLDKLDLHDPAIILAGAKALLRDFIGLGMPLALSIDELLRAMIYGSQSLLDDVQVRERYTTARDAQELPTNNVRSFIGYDGRERADVLRAVLGSYLVKIGRGEFREHQMLIERELRRSDVIDVIVGGTDTNKPGRLNGCLTSVVTAAALTTVISVGGRALLKRLG